MAEEYEFQSPENGQRLCANNCGFFGSPATQNYCSKCFQEQTSGEPLISTELMVAPPYAADKVVVMQPHVAEQVVALRSDAAEQVVARPNRCFICRKKVGLMGFKCRCGTTFCGTHRYPEVHACTFDFKSTGREAIAKANPLIKAEKLEKI